MLAHAATPEGTVVRHARSVDGCSVRLADGRHVLLSPASAEWAIWGVINEAACEAVGAREGYAV